jgi:hypothetical protein
MGRIRFYGLLYRISTWARVLTLIELITITTLAKKMSEAQFGIGVVTLAITMAIAFLGPQKRPSS